MKIMDIFFLGFIWGAYIITLIQDIIFGFHLLGFILGTIIVIILTLILTIKPRDCANKQIKQRGKNAK